MELLACQVWMAGTGEGEMKKKKKEREKKTVGLPSSLGELLIVGLR